MYQIMFTAAAGLSTAWLGVHIFLGGPQIARPLLASDLEPMVKYTQYMCWHMVTGTIAILIVFFGLAALGFDDTFALAGVLLSAAISVVGIGIVAGVRQSHAKHPQGWLFLPLVALGLAGLYF